MFTRMSLALAASITAALWMPGRASAADAEQRFGQPGTVKVRVDRSSVTPQLLTGGVRVVADYGSFTLLEVPISAVPMSDGVEVLPDANRILLKAGVIDTTQPAARLLQQARAPFSGKALHLVQFAGPVQPAWHAALSQTGAQIVSYVPSNAYLVYGDFGQLTAVQALAAGAAHVQWEGAYLDEYKIHPAANPRNNAANDLFAIQLVADPAANPATLAVVDRLKTAPVLNQFRVLNYVNIVARIPPDKIAEVAQQPDVVFIEPFTLPEMFGERQAQIVAGNLSGTAPSGPGYLAWLASKGFTQAQFDASNFVVDVTDSGIDNGTSLPNHFALYPDGVISGTSRVAYNRAVGTSTGTLKGCDGHGNIDAHIVAGFIPDSRTGPTHVDGAGFRYGQGIAPFVRVGSSVIFDPDFIGDTDFSELQSLAYEDDARVSSNSWGANDPSYTVFSQMYDAFVRDAQQSGTEFPAVGNQEMVIVFANGNAGPSFGTVGTPATAKNVISVGAAENVQVPFGTCDGLCGFPDSLADNANDIASFSSRGPCSDGRKKPDIVAPGTRITGGVIQADSPDADGTADACFDGSGVCGGPCLDASPCVPPCDIRELFFPTGGQQFYTASSGTSHACPAVSGGCALIRQYFINHNLLPGGAPPSPAMTKALLMNSGRYLTGDGANDAFWSNAQGMGEMNLGEAFRRGTVTRTVFRDQLAADRFTQSGQTRIFMGTINQPPPPASQDTPFKVTLVWTDAPGFTGGGPALQNDLDLTVTVGTIVYRGNNFSGQFSNSGTTPDHLNNVESVFVFQNQAIGNFTVTVTANNIVADALNIGSLSQDFALIIDNVSCPIIAIGPDTGLPDLVVGAPYSQQLTASDGAGPYEFEITSGTLPPGLELSLTGLLSGTPTTSGVFTFTVEATDSEACKGSKNFTISPPLAFAPFPTMATCVKVPSAPLGPEPLVSGGKPPYSYTWNVLSGPSVFDAADVNKAHPTLTPPVSLDYVLQVEAVDSSQPAKTATKTAPLLVTSKPTIDSGLYTKYHPILTVGQTLAFGKEFSVSGGIGPFTFHWSFLDNPNGAGVLMNADSKDASFTTTQPGTYTILADVQPAAGCGNQTHFALTVVSNEPISRETGTDGTDGGGGGGAGLSGLCAPLGFTTLGLFMVGFGWLRFAGHRRRGRTPA